MSTRLQRNLRQIRTTTWTIADAAGLRLAVCPPPMVHECDRDLGRVSRDAYVGETVRIPFRLTNDAGRRRVLALAAEPLRSASGTVAATPTLTPSTLDLLESQAGLVVIGIEVTSAFVPGLDYASAVTVTSKCCEPQELRIRLRVRSDDRAPSFPVCCSGRIPAR